MKHLIADILGRRFLLHPFRAALWEEERILLLADLHLGKARHFRRNGIPVPASVSTSNWDRLISLLIDLQPERVIFLGDLFHSEYNREWDELGDLIRQFDPVRFELVPGNHDILDPEQYRHAGLVVHPEELTIGTLIFSHHPLEVVPEDYYNLAGHIHPGIFLKGNGRQRLKLPCFYFGKKQGILPAFGAFTGTAKMKVKEEDRVYVIAGEKVVEV